ncbi:M15 family metallopeptidase [Streptomyces sp. NPDC002640]
MSIDIVLMSDPRVATMPVHECGEPLVDVRGRGGIQVDGRRADAAGAHAHVRQGVLDRLLQGQSMLPDGMHLLVVEGYRPPVLQQRYFDTYATWLAQQHPDWAATRIREAASRFVSPPEIAPHSAGAAVDLTLLDEHGAEVNMGTPVNANPEESDNACYTEAANIAPAARAMRDLLATVLNESGLRNYPTEWWHWSYGDRYWALRTGQHAALYGPIDLPRPSHPSPA